MSAPASENPSATPRNPANPNELALQTSPARPSSASDLSALKAVNDLEGYSALALELTTRPLGTESDCILISEAVASMGHPAEAAAYLERALKIHPGSVHLHHNYGVALQGLKRYNESFEAFRRAVELRPYSDVSLTMAGSVLRILGRLSEALEFHGAAIRVNPTSALALYNMGNALQEQGELHAAADAYRKALALQPDWEDLLHNLCVTLSQIDRFGEAAPHLLKLTKMRGNQPRDLARLAFALRECNRPGEALEIAQILLQLAPQERKYRMLHAAILTRVGRSAEAVAEYTKAIKLNPDLTDAYEAIVYCANYLPYEDPQELFEFYRNYSRLIEQPKASKRYTVHPVRRFPRKLRVGYVSGDFCNHPVASFIEPILLSHNASAFEVFCYYNFARVDQITERIRSLPWHWRQVESLSDEAFCELVRTDGIDILVDLAGHSTRNRLPAFALKPAPVQVTMIGCMQTTGLQSMDYRITDARLDPEGLSESLNSERLIRMQTGALCFKPYPQSPDPAPTPALHGRPFTFGSYNNLAKLTPQVLDLWAKVLDHLPETRMQIIADSGEFFLREMQKRGIPSQRFTVLPRLPVPGYLASHAEVDLILDTFPFAGLTVSMNSLWMGVPMVTLTGNTSASRAGANLLKRVELDQFIASSPDEYVSIAARFARNPQALAPIRESLRGLMAAHWCDATAHTRELESQFVGMWERFSRTIPELNPLLEGGLGAVVLEQGQPPLSPGEQPVSPATPHVLVPEHLPVPVPLAPSLDPVLEARLETIEATVDPSKLLEEFLVEIVADSELRRALTVRLHKVCPSVDNWKKAALCVELLLRAETGEVVEEALEKVRQCLQTASDYSWWARSLLRQGKRVEATEAFETACKLPDVRPDALLGLACLLTEDGDRDRAEALCRKSIGLSPSVWESYLNLGHLLYQKGSFREALLVAEPAIRFSSDPALLMNLAVYQEKCAEFMAAIRTLEKVIEKVPDSSSAFLNLGNCLLFLGLPNEASAAYRRSRQFEPDSANSFSNHLHSLNYVSGVDPETAFNLHREFSQRFEAPLRPHQPHSNLRDPERRLRIAYVSPDLRGHSVAFFVEPLFRHHDRAQFEVWGVLSHTWQDFTTERLKGICDGWLDAGNLSHEALAEKLRSLEIDVLVDLICHSQGSRLLTFARKPAPIQITMIGMQQTSGLDAMDYRVTDAFMDPPGTSERFHSEQLMRLPLAFCFQPPTPEPGQQLPPIAPLPALKNGFVTFGSFNNFAKANSEVLKAWAQVLKLVPNSRLVAVAPEGTPFEATMVAEGIALERIIASPRKSHDAYLHMHDEIDFVLDCFPFGGLTVSAIAAWMGVPTLTVAGNTPSARAGAALQHSLGLDEFIASDPEDYVQKAVLLAADLPRLAEIRQSMRTRMAVQLSNGEAYTQAFEREIRSAWRHYCKTPL
jgi:predicted O-linked N-acetylglucosamine transferase (SPINDLY family)